jgi:hypothetical protein
METYGDILNPVALAKFQSEIDAMKVKLSKYSGTWVDRNPFLRELVLWYYERKFLNKVKKLTRGN